MLDLIQIDFNKIDLNYDYLDIIGFKLREKSLLDSSLHNGLKELREMEFDMSLIEKYYNT